jgi:hypothetical protein
LKRIGLAENLRVGREGDAGAAPVLRLADGFEGRGRQAAGEGLAIEVLVAGHLDHRIGRERIDHADADAVEAADVA